MGGWEGSEGMEVDGMLGVRSLKGKLWLRGCGEGRLRGEVGEGKKE